MGDLTLLVALAAGALALLSPCSALLLPSFFAYAFGSRTTTVARTGVFLLGLMTTLVPLGMGAATASRLFYGNRELLISVAGWTVVALGLWQLAGRGFSLPFADRLRNAQAGSAGTGWPSTYTLGTVYGLAGFCSGPVLGAILTVAATRDSVWAGGALLAAYSVGMVLPLLLLALVWDRFGLGSRTWLRGRVLRVGPWEAHTTSVVSGLLLVVVGAVFLRYDGTAGLLGSLGLGDTTDLEYAAQTWLLGTLGRVPSWLLPVVLLVGALGVAAARLRGTPAGSEESGRAEAEHVDQQA